MLIMLMIYEQIFDLFSLLQNLNVVCREYK